jgi:hypothetical protein
MIKPTSDRAAIVDTEFHWIDATEHPPPRGAKILCINRMQGIAVIGSWLPTFGFTHWAPLPTFEKPKEI